MKTTNQLYAVLVAVAVSTLAACGGGGGGGGASATPPPPTPTATLLAMIPGNGAVGVPTGIKPVFTLTVTNADSSDASKLSFLCNSKATAFTAQSVIASGVSTSTLSPATSLTLGDTCTLSGNITTTGAGGLVATPVSMSFAVVATPAVLHYTDKVYALWDGGMPWVVTKTGATRVINKTHLTGGAPVTSCWLADKPLGDGTVLTSCLDARNGVEATRAPYYINPVTEELYDYVGVVPADVVWHKGSPLIDSAHLTWYAEVHVADGWYYSLAADATSLYFQADATGATTVVRAAPPFNGVYLLMTYSN